MDIIFIDFLWLFFSVFVLFSYFFSIFFLLDISGYTKGSRRDFFSRDYLLDVAFFFGYGIFWSLLFTESITWLNQQALQLEQVIWVRGYTEGLGRISQAFINRVFCILGT